MVNNYSIDFKYTAVKLYLKLNSIRKVSLLLDCSKTSIQRWLDEYFETGEIVKKYKQRDSIITNKILIFIKESIQNNNTITLGKIKKNINKQFNLEISISYLFYIIKYKLNLTYKQLRKKYYPLQRGLF
jgi:transposase